MIGRTLAAVVLIVAGCAAPSEDGARRTRALVALARGGGFQGHLLATPALNLAAWTRVRPGARVLHVYVEGDGAAWRDRHHLNHDPTPAQPLALRLALQDPAPGVAWLGRPCQTTLATGQGRGCTPALWSTARYGETVIAATDGALDQLKARTGADDLMLVGVSGGAAVAALVAARRPDVIALRTVAGTLDPQAVTRHHGVTPLRDSLTPLAVAPRLRALPQIHYQGGRDAVVPAVVARTFVAAQGPGACARVRTVPGADHHRGWVTAWPRLLAGPLPCHTAPSAP